VQTKEIPANGPGPTTKTMTIDELAAAAGTTSRRIRSFQTLGLLPHPDLRGRTGLYGADHRARLTAILRLQGQGFSLESLGVLFRAFDAGLSLSTVLGVGEPQAATTSEAAGDEAERYGFAELQPAARGRRDGRRPLLSVVPTTMWEHGETEAEAEAS
jgi:DNA-binding transcriptional MerR regulator